MGRVFLTIWDLSSIWRFVYIYISKYLSSVMFYMVLEWAPMAQYWGNNTSSNTAVVSHVQKRSCEEQGNLELAVYNFPMQW